ncbi:hypothetical protein NM688_g8305 [Phlebia brevispora]|uniref:Uncharacterized protein n=1 Tax=Phlebia brevispora TaxID=194682 RepID=A0ACC1RU64_9APHY|nr:hypothetical protein NM688_g8305 [Phlebia brevispora]
MTSPAASIDITKDTLPKLTSLPIINIGPYLHDHDKAGRLCVSAALHAACLEYGFFYLDISEYVDPSEPEELTKLARQFFELPQEEKEKISLQHQDYARGYQRLKENVTNGKADNHEAIDFYRPVENPDKTKPLWGENQWPTAIPGFREKYERWIEKMKKLGVIVMEAMAVGLGCTPEEWEDFKSKIDDSFWVMRIIGYPPLPNAFDGFSCGAHRDYGCLTFLYTDPTKGALEVFLREPGLVIQATPGLPPGETVEEGTWIKADPIPGCVVCNIGDMWETWTNGLYRSTLHRVIHRGTNYRVSIPFFFEPNFDAVVQPLPAALRLQDGDSKVFDDYGLWHHDEEHKLAEKRYHPIVYGEFLKKKVGGNFAGSGGGKYS